MILGALRSSICLGAILYGAAPALAQLGAPIVPGDGFRRAPQTPSVTAPAPAAPAQPVAAARPAQARPVETAVPTYDESTYLRVAGALRVYSDIAARGGWPTVPKGAKLGPGANGPEVTVLRQRLAVTGDLEPSLKAGAGYDDAVTAAVKRFQARHGLSETGSVGPLTFEALNVTAETRVRQLTASMERLAATSFIFGQRYVVVNIPAAMVEAVAGGRVERRYVAVVGKPERPSPTLTTNITAVNLNPTWTVPLSIVKKDIMPKMRQDPSYLARMRMRLLDGGGNEISPEQVDWNGNRVPAFAIRQDAGSWNALGAVRIDMPNAHSVYMHDTNHKGMFNSDYRFQSSGCARVNDPRDLAAWLLQDTEGWGRREIDAGIATGKRVDIRLARSVPVAWIYLTGWAAGDGAVHFRKDVYDHDDAPARPFMVSVPRPVVTAARASGFTLQSGESRPARLKEVSYLDSQ
jgi:murein L,D-transpeptidase YcbB/YkuD